jgi:hypothetical protein
VVFPLFSVFALSMDLPQTNAGVPAPGIDPTTEELALITTLGGAFDWLGTGQATRTATCVALGADAPRLRDIVYIKGGDWDRAVNNIAVEVDGGGSRDPSPLELGHLAMLRRICRLCLGLCAVEISNVAPQAVGVPGGMVPLVSQGTTLAIQGGIPSVPTTDTKLKLSLILDPSLDADLVRLPHLQVRGLFNTYAQVRGAEPAEDVEPTVEQISAVAQVVAADLVPYADFALLGPHGRRLVGKLSYLAWTFQPDGTWHRKELPGPPSFEHWWSSFRVLRTIFLLLDVAPPELLDNYGEMVRGFHALYGPSAWFLIYTADVRMRSEHFDRLRRYAERDHDVASSIGIATTSSFDPAKPWHATFKAALADKLWWDDNLHRPAILFLTRVKTANECVADGTVQDALDGNGSGRQTRSRSRRRSRQNQRGGHRHLQDRHGPGRSRHHSGGGAGGGARIVCVAFNTPGGCHRPDGCPDSHVCSACGKQNHGKFECRSRPGGPAARLSPRAPTPPRSSRQGGYGGKGGGGGKGKGKGGGKY